MNVTLLSYTACPEEICTLSAKICYSDPVDLADLRDGGEYLKGIIDSGHLSVIEHASFTFLVTSVSRTLTHQLVRHRVASFSQQSQRYVSIDKPSYVTPPTIEDDLELKRKYDDMMMYIWDVYSKLKERIPSEDARYVLPNGCTTNITITMNARELLHFFSLRCCNRAQWEIREMAERMMDLCKNVSPIIFRDAGAPCVRGRCPEGKRSCGNPKTRTEEGV